MKNTIYIANNLPVLEGLESESIDLIYLDPPFNSKRLHSAPVGSAAAGAEFKDMWKWDEDVDKLRLEGLIIDYPGLASYIATVGKTHSRPMQAYVMYMAQRIVEMHRVLKNTGCLYLHCDPTASHYLKVVLDRVFGEQNYLSEVVWKRNSAHSSAKRYGPIHDVIFLYSKSRKYSWNKHVKQPYEQGYLEKTYRHKDKQGRRFKTSDLTGAGLTRQGQSGKEWQGVNPSSVGRHWAVPRADKMPEWAPVPDWYDGATTFQKLDWLDAHGLIHWTDKAGGKPQFKRYLSQADGVALQDIVLDIPPLSDKSDERTGYPTQKPLALLKRIIRVSSNPGDVIMDPFCGCATTMVAVAEINAEAALAGDTSPERKWIGIDVSPKAAELISLRLDWLDMLTRTKFDVLEEPPMREGHLTPMTTAQYRQRMKEKGNWHYCAGKFCSLRPAPDAEGNLVREKHHIDKMEVDHIKPRAVGGLDVMENYQLLCRGCNGLKRDKPMEFLNAKLAAIHRSRLGA